MSETRYMISETAKKVDVEAHAFSATAEAAIKEKGGNAIKL